MSDKAFPRQRAVNGQIDHPCIASLHYPCNNAFCIKIHMSRAHCIFESHIFPQQFSSLPPEKTVSTAFVGPSFSGPLTFIRDTIHTLASFGCSRVEFKGDPAISAIALEGVGIYGSLCCYMEASETTAYVFTGSKPFVFESKKFSISSLSAILGHASVSPQDMSKSVLHMKWNDTGMRLQIEWEHDDCPEKNAVGEFILVPYIL